MAELDETYRQAKEKFYQGHSGGSSLEVVLITSIPPVSVLLSQCIGLCITGTSSGGVVAAVLATLLTSLPTYAAFVAPSFAAHILFAQLAAAAACIFLLGPGIKPAASALQDIAEALNRPHKPFLASYRGMMMLATCIAILAVDFQNFPRRFAKTETYGVSLMDAGVGSVLLSQAIVSPLARHPSTAAAKRGLSALLSSTPLIAIGSIRLLGVRAANYQEHHSEYGVHWNFFFTLAAITTLGNMLPLTGWRAAACACLLTASYEIVLHTTQLTPWILSSPRVDLLSANREGLLGCVGYSAVFYGGVALGGLVATGTPKSGASWVRSACGLVGLSGVLWGGVGVLELWGMRVSRRLVNAPYVMWTLAYNTSALAWFMFLEMALHFAVGRGGLSALAWRGASGRHSELLSDAINRNQLFIFLISNLLTGLVNISLPTLYATDTQACATMVAYILLVTSVAFLLERRRVTLKFW